MKALLILAGVLIGAFIIIPGLYIVWKLIYRILDKIDLAFYEYERAIERDDVKKWKKENF